MSEERKVTENRKNEGSRKEGQRKRWRINLGDEKEGDDAERKNLSKEGKVTWRIGSMEGERREYRKRMEWRREEEEEVEVNNRRWKEKRWPTPVRETWDKSDLEVGRSRTGGSGRTRR